MGAGHVGLIAHGGSTITGNERYILGLARALARRDDELRYTVFYTQEAVRESVEPTNGNFRFQKIWAETPWLRLTIALPAAVRRAGVDLLHSQYGLPAFTRTPAVVTVHDIFYVRWPRLYPTLQRLQLGYRVRRALKVARRIIVPSEFSKADIIDYYGVDERKIAVVHLGIDDRFRPLDDAELRPLRERYRLPERFVLFVGAFVPRKNLLRLVSAYAGLPQEMRRSFPLLLAGSPGWMSSPMMARIRPLEAEGSVRLLGYVPEADLPGLMNLATVLALPSITEGFGFPALEAMRCGTCVLVARAGSLPELVGDAGFFVDPLNAESIRRGLIQLLRDPGILARLAERGRHRASTFTWDRTAEAISAVFREALSPPTSSPLTAEEG